MKSKISEYLASKDFRDAASAATEKAIADVVAKGLDPACDPMPETPNPPKVVLIPRKKPTDDNVTE